MLIFVSFVLYRTSVVRGIAIPVEDTGGVYYRSRGEPSMASIIRSLAGGGTSNEDTILFLPGRVSDAWLKQQRFRLERLAPLNLTINNPRVTDAGIAELTGISEFRRLDLADTSITDASMGTIAKLRFSAGAVLSVARTRVSDAAISQLLQTPAGTRIGGLELHSGQLTAASIAAIQANRPLSWFGLYDADDDSISRLLQLKLIAGVVIQGEDVSSSSLPVLEQLIQANSLISMTLLDVPFTEAELQRLKQFDVSCRVFAQSSDEQRRFRMVSRPGNSR
ncbi:MAG: hypothetical protein R3C19_19020 [Planctomycetaceae bacterium]